MKKEYRELTDIIAKEYPNITGIIIRHQGKVAYENYFQGFTADDAVHVFSVTKSVISALIGIALDKGHIQSVDQRVFDFFPDYAIPPGETAARDITLRHLLTMTATYKYETEPYEAFFRSENWINFALDVLGGEKPGGQFRYAAIVGTHILSGILMNATGRPALDYAQEYLFSPLGMNISDYGAFHSAEEQMAWYARGKHKSGWVRDRQGVHAASWGLAIRPMDMAKIGRLYLDGGVWEGKEIVPARWIRESTAEHSRWRERNLSYGYLWWILGDRKYAALGDGGNAIYVDAEKELVVAIAARMLPDSKDALDLIATQIEPRLN